MKSKPCGKQKDCVCIWKSPHLWKECPSNPWGINKDRKVSNDGETLLYTVAEFSATMCNDDDPVMDDRLYGMHGEE